MSQYILQLPKPLLLSLLGIILLIVIGLGAKLVLDKLHKQNLAATVNFINSLDAQLANLNNKLGSVQVLLNELNLKLEVGLSKSLLDQQKIAKKRASKYQKQIDQKLQQRESAFQKYLKLDEQVKTAWF